MPKRGGQSSSAKSRRQAKSSALNKKYRAEAAKLKKLGVLSDKVNARANISRSTRTKINKFRDVLEGKAIAVRAKPEIRKQYSEKGILPERGAFLIAPKQYEQQKAEISRGMVKVHRPLKNGREEYVILPVSGSDLPELIENIRENNDAIDNLKEPEEQFAFRLYGHNSTDAFYDANDLAEGLEHYVSKFAGSAENPVQFLTFQRFAGSTAGRHKSKERKFYSVNAKGRNHQVEGTVTRQRRERDKLRKRKLRANETKEQREKRLKRDRIYSAQYRERKFFED